VSNIDRPEGSSSRPLPPRLDPRAGQPSRHMPGGASGMGRAGHGRLAGTVRIVAGLLSLVLLGTSGWGWYLGRVAEASVNRTDAIPSSGNDEVVNTGEAMNLLLVGNDSRAGATDAELKELNTQANEGLNTDTMILVHVPGDGSKASFVSFPRDSYVSIPGHGKDKLNAAYAYGTQDAPKGASNAAVQAAGAQLLIKTISSLTGLHIDHYAEVDLLGFFKLSSVIGGVQVNLCNAVQDSFSGINLPAGVQTISGEQALAFVRQRHGLPRGDFDRIIRQQTFIAAMIRKMVSDNVLLDLGKQRQLVQAAADALTVDQTLNLLNLAQQMQSVTPGSIDFQTVPYIGDDKDSAGRYILRLQDTDKLHTFFAQLSADPQAPAAAPTTAAPQTAAPADVSVEVYNGSGTSGLAGKAATALTSAGFKVTGTANADSQGYKTTEIRFAAGDDALAATLAAAIPGAVTKQVDNATTGTVQLVLGADFNGVGQAVTPPAPAAAAAPASTAATTQGEDQRTAADTSCIN
jgi:LCP family protein required for cell wall assembly